MSTRARMLGFVVAAAVVFALALGLGRVVGPTTEPAAAHDDMGAGGHAAMAVQDAAQDEEPPGGLMSSEDGYSLELAETTAAPGDAVPLGLTITGPDGEPVTAYDVEHDKRLHLILVRRDFTGFQHLHPTLSDGVWTTEAALTPGVWRVFADFKPTGADALTLGADLAVPGELAAVPPAPETRTARVDGYTVTLDGDLRGGEDAELTLSVSKDGRPVTDLEPYLGAYGHLVALREGDLAYLHVHPDGEPGDGRTAAGPGVTFHASVPSSGTYHLYLDFQHDGAVHTATFAQTAEEAR